MRLRNGFVRLLTDPVAYERRALAECAAFPEGDLFPFTQPILGFASAASRDPAFAIETAQLSASLVELAIRAVVRKLRPPANRLDSLRDYAGEAVYLGHLAMSLGFHRLMSGEVRFDSLRERLVNLLHDALLRGRGKPLNSFPGISWPFDTIPPLVALYLDDLIQNSSGHTGVINEHIAWVRGQGSDPVSGLPWSRMTGRGGGPVPPRGCDLSWRVPLLALFDREAAVDLYRRYCRAHWIDRGLLAGFAEYPHGRNLGADVDSGPIVLGIGLVATGFGISAAECTGDSWRLARCRRRW
jgi:hypothetical protein